MPKEVKPLGTFGENSSKVRSSFPSPVKSATIKFAQNTVAVARQSLVPGGVTGTLVNFKSVGAETSKNRTLDVPPPGLGLDTVMKAVDAEAIFAAGTVAVSCELLTNVVVKAVPFQLITDPGTNPVPFIVSLKLGPPGGVAVGTSG